MRNLMTVGDSVRTSKSQHVGSDVTHPICQYHEQPADEVALGVRRLLNVVGPMFPWRYCRQFIPPIRNILLEGPNYTPKKRQLFPSLAGGIMRSERLGSAMLTWPQGIDLRRFQAW